MCVYVIIINSITLISLLFLVHYHYFFILLFFGWIFKNIVNKHFHSIDLKTSNQNEYDLIKADKVIIYINVATVQMFVGSFRKNDSKDNTVLYYDNSYAPRESIVTYWHLVLTTA